MAGGKGLPGSGEWRGPQSGVMGSWVAGNIGEDIKGVFDVLGHPKSLITDPGRATAKRRLEERNITWRGGEKEP